MTDEQIKAIEGRLSASIVAAVLCHEKTNTKTTLAVMEATAKSIGDIPTLMADNRAQAAEIKELKAKMAAKGYFDDA